MAPDFRWDLPLRLFGALHYLALAGRAPELARAYAGEGDAWPAFRATLEAESEFVADFLRNQGVQTNEAQRCYGLLPAFLVLARETDKPFDLLELGPSAGFNLLWDRYRYRYGGESWGPAGSRLALDGELRGPLPGRLLQARPRVRNRVGVDLNPVDVTTEEGALLLRCFIWPDQRRREARLRRAIDVLRSDPPELLQGDYVELLPELLARRDERAFTVVFQTASFGYLSAEQRARIDETLEREGRRTPLAFISASQPDDESLLAWSLRMRIWPGGQERTLAHMDYHGEWLEWLAR